MDKKQTCFVISPIGQEGTEIFEQYKDLFDLLIVPALEIFNIDVCRGDHMVNDALIDESVIRHVKEADICICDISEPNPNVYYELGRRDETERPILLLKRKDSAKSPVDIASRRYFEYNWNDPRTIRSAQNYIRAFVKSVLEKKKEKETHKEKEKETHKVSSLFDGLDIPNYLRWKTTLSTSDINDLLEVLKASVETKSKRQAENVMQKLYKQMPLVEYLQKVVMPAAYASSRLALSTLCEHAVYFCNNNDVTLQQKMAYYQCILECVFDCNDDYNNNKLEAAPVIKLFGRKFDSQIVAMMPDNTDEQTMDSLKTNMQTLIYKECKVYFMYYHETNEIIWLDLCINDAHRLSTTECSEDDSIHYNYLLILFNLMHYEKSHDEEHLRLAVATLDQNITNLAFCNKPQIIKLACKVFWNSHDHRFQEMLDRYTQMKPDDAAKLLSELQKPDT